MPHIIPRPEDAAQYLLKEERDYDILERIYALELMPLAPEDARVVALIRTQLEHDWRTPLLTELDQLIARYHADPNLKSLHQRRIRRGRKI